MLGDFDTDSFGQRDLWLVWILFVVASILFIVVLLNLLISIIGDTYGRV